MGSWSHNRHQHPLEEKSRLGQVYPGITVLTNRPCNPDLLLPWRPKFRRSRFGLRPVSLVEARKPNSRHKRSGRCDSRQRSRPLPNRACLPSGPFSILDNAPAYRNQLPPSTSELLVFSPSPHLTWLQLPNRIIPIRLPPGNLRKLTIPSENLWSTIIEVGIQGSQ